MTSPVWCAVPQNAMSAALNASIHDLYVLSAFLFPVLILTALLSSRIKTKSKTGFYIFGIILYTAVTISVSIASGFIFGSLMLFGLVLHLPYFLAIGCLPLAFLLASERKRVYVKGGSVVPRFLFGILVLLGIAGMAIYLYRPITEHLAGVHTEIRPVQSPEACTSIGGEVWR